MATTVPKEVFIQYKRKTKRKVLFLLLPILLLFFLIACFGGYQFYQLSKRMKKLEKMIQKHHGVSGVSEEVHSRSLGSMNAEVAELSMSVGTLQKQYKEMEKQTQLVLSEFSKRLKDLTERTEEEKQQFFYSMNNSLLETREEVKQILSHRNSSDLDHERNVAQALQVMEDKFSKANETLGYYIMEKFKSIRREQEEQQKGYQRGFDNNISLLLDMIDNLNNTRLAKVEGQGRRNQTNWSLEEDVRELKEGRESCVKIEDFHATEAYLEGKFEELSKQVRGLSLLFKKRGERPEFAESFTTALDEFGHILNALV